MAIDGFTAELLVSNQTQSYCGINEVNKAEKENVANVN